MGSLRGAGGIPAIRPMQLGLASGSDLCRSLVRQAVLARIRRFSIPVGC